MSAYATYGSATPVAIQTAPVAAAAIPWWVAMLLLVTLAIAIVALVLVFTYRGRKGDTGLTGPTGPPAPDHVQRFVIYVDQFSAATPQTGSFTNPYLTVQQAINRAVMDPVDPDIIVYTIVVNPGNYNENVVINDPDGVKSLIFDSVGETSLGTVTWNAGPSAVSSGQLALAFVSQEQVDRSSINPSDHFLSWKLGNVYVNNPILGAGHPTLHLVNTICEDISCVAKCTLNAYSSRIATIGTVTHTVGAGISVLRAFDTRFGGTVLIDDYGELLNCLFIGPTTINSATSSGGGPEGALLTTFQGHLTGPAGVVRADNYTNFQLHAFAVVPAGGASASSVQRDVNTLPWPP